MLKLIVNITPFKFSEAKFSYEKSHDDKAIAEVMNIL